MKDVVDKEHDANQKGKDEWHHNESTALAQSLLGASFLFLLLEVLLHGQCQGVGQRGQQTGLGVLEVSIHVESAYDITDS